MEVSRGKLCQKLLSSGPSDGLIELELSREADLMGFSLFWDLGENTVWRKLLKEKDAG